jgi:hypothetical protein
LRVRTCRMRRKGEKEEEEERRKDKGMRRELEN